MEDNPIPRVLVIGTGSIGERPTRCFLATGRCEVSICEINDEVRLGVADRYDLAAAHADLDSALAASPEIAVICTPAHLHVDMAIGLLEAGVAVLCEKPLSTSMEGIEQLGTLTAEHDAKFSMAYVMRAHPLWNDLCSRVRSDEFGRPIEIVVLSGQHFPHYRPAYRIRHRHRRLEPHRRSPRPYPLGRGTASRRHCDGGSRLQPVRG